MVYAAIYIQRPITEIDLNQSLNQRENRNPSATHQPCPEKKNTYHALYGLTEKNV